MERLKKTEVLGREKIQYRKIGGGSLRLKLSGQNRIIKQNELFSAYPDEIPPAFKDTIVPTNLAYAAKVEEAAKPKPVKVTFTLKPHGKSKSLFDVVDGLGKILNDKALPKAIAEQLINDLAK